jgi:hypothetical protein
MQTGYIYHYTLSILIGSTLLFGLRQLWLIFDFFIDYRIFILIILLLFFIINIKNEKNN